MTITIITSPFCELPPDAIGAVERLWSNIAIEFSRLRHSVTVIGKRGSTVLPDDENIKWRYVRGYDRSASIYMDIVRDLFFSFRALCQMPKCDVLVCNTFWTPILAPKLFRRKYRKLVYNVQRFPKRHFKLYGHVDLFECASSAVKAALVKQFPVYEHRVKVVSNPLDVSVFRPLSAGQKRDFLIGYHGRVNKEKGLDALACAVGALAQDYPDLRIRMIGSWEVARGGDGDGYRKHLDRLSGGRIDWMGPISDPVKLAAALRECSLYCYPSVAEKGETFGVSPLEAMGLGIPTIVSGLKCFADYAEDGRNVIVFDHRSENHVRNLTEKLAQVIEDDELRKRLSACAANTTRNFSTAKIARRYLDDFEILINEGET